MRGARPDSCDHVPVTGSTLYRRLPDGTWAAEREDAAQGSAGPSDEPAAAAAGAADAGGAAAAVAAPGAPAPPAGVPKGRRRLRPLRILKWAVIAYVVWILGLLVYAAMALPKVDALSPNPIADTPGTTWLLVGSDSRAELSKKEQRQLRTGNEEGQRTDTIMLVHMSGLGSPRLVSVPRDSWVTIPAHTATDGSEVDARSGKINAAYAYGGAPLLSETIEYNTGLHVDHYMEVGMGGIVTMTDAVGGIEVCFDEPIKDKNSGLDVTAGCQTLDGRDSLAWVRMRYADPTGDLGRMERQQEYVRLMIDQMLSWQTLVNPFRQLSIVNAVLDSVKVDNDTGSLDLGRLGLGMGRVASGSAEVTSVPTLDGDNWENGQWVLKWDPAESAELFGAMGAGTPQAASDDEE
jgi:LCP family protein required for cell wall assembly